MHTPRTFASMTLAVAMLLGASSSACDSGGASAASCHDDASCGAGKSCVNAACVAGERCGALLCAAAQVCDANACIASPYDRDYIVTLVSAATPTAHFLVGTVEIGGHQVVRAGPSSGALNVSWGASARVHVGPGDALHVTLVEPGSWTFVDETDPRVPVALLVDGSYTVTGKDGATIVLAARPATTPANCSADGDCVGAQHCDVGTCTPGDRCGAAICGAGEICGDTRCVSDPLATGPYTLTLVGAKLLHAVWDTGFDDGVPDPTATISLDGAPIIDGPEQLNTFDATWNLSVTRTFETFATLRVLVVDTDIDGANIAIDKTFTRFPYALVRDGTLTISDTGSSVTLTMAPATARGGH